MSDLIEEIGIQFSLFSTGFAAGLVVLGAEMELFFSSMIFDMIIDAFSVSLPVTEPSQSVISQYIGIMAIISIAGLIQGVALGYFKRTFFSIGYCSGIFLMVIILGNILWDVVQPVVIGMIVTLITVIIGIGLKVLILNKDRNEYGRSN